MKSFTYLFVILLFIPSLIWAQDEPQKLNVKLSGYVGYEMYFDTYNSVQTRDGEIYLYPKTENLDINGDDINKNFQSQMLSIQSRTRLTASGIEAFGAKISGVIEGDFVGTHQDYTRLFRLRHAFVKMDWSKSQLIVGQTWHPTFVTDCFPGVFAFGAGLPFQPLNRAPQVRYTLMPSSNLSFMGALISHGYHKSAGPTDAQRNSGFPEMQFQFKFKNEMFLAGFTAGYKTLTPRLETADGIKTNETIGSYNLQFFTKLTTKPLTVKFEAVYGQNTSHLVMIGGYGAAEDTALIDDYSYANINTLSIWSEVHTNFKKFNAGVFFGYSSNLSANDDYYSLGYARGEGIDYIYRISPRVQYTSGKVTFTLEHMLTGAAYGTLDEVNPDYSFTDTDKPTINHRILLGAKFVF
jgi:hypothetical protein